MRFCRTFVALWLAAAACAGSAQAAYPGVSGAIAWQVFSVDPNGSQTDSIETQGGTVVSCDSGGGSLACDFGRPSYSPDGSILVVARQAPDPRGGGRGGSGALMLVGSDGSNPRTLPKQTTDDEEPAFLPSGTAVVFTGTSPAGQNLYSVRTDGTGLRQLTTGGGSWPAPCPNGTVAFQRRGDLYLLGADLRSIRRLTSGAGLRPSCSPDSRTIAFVRDNALYTVGADGKALRHIATPHPVLYPAYAPGGHAIAYETGYDQPSSDGSVSEIDVVNLQGRPALRDIIGGTSAGSLGEDTVQSDGGAIDWQPAASGPPPALAVGLVPGSPFATSRALTCSVAFSPNGRLLATANTRGYAGGCTPIGSGSGSVGVFSVQASGALRPIHGSPFAAGHNLDARSVAFAPDGRLLAVAVNRIVAGRRSFRPIGSSVGVFSVARSGSLRPVHGSPFRNGPSVAESLAFRPDGRFVAVGSNTGRVSVFALGRSGALRQVRGSPFRSGSPHPASAIAFSPDGTHLATANDDGTISVLSVDRATGSLRSVSGSPFQAGGGGPLAFSPSGRLLAAAGGSLQILSVDPATGSLSPVSNPPLYGLSSAAVAFNPAGTLLAAPSSGFGGVAVFSVSPAGALTQVVGLPWMPGSMYSTGADTPGPAAGFDPTGHTLALAESGAGVSILRIH